MKKKGEDIGNWIYPLLIVFVLLVSGYLLYDFTVSKDAPPNRLGNWVAQNFGYKEEYQSLDRIQTEINDIVAGCPGDPSVIGKIDDEISKLEARQAGTVQDYMLRKFRDMKDRAQSSLKYCEAIDAFNSLADFDGKEAKPFEDSLGPIKQKFVDVGDNQNFQSVILAKEKIALLEKMIKDCKDIKQGKCTAGNTKKFCVWTTKCVPAVCAGAEEALCTAIEKQTKVCFAYYTEKLLSSNLEFSSCRFCDTVTKCEHYLFASEACVTNFCKVNEDCEAPRVPTGESDLFYEQAGFLKCRPKGAAVTCDDLNSDGCSNDKYVTKCEWNPNNIECEDRNICTLLNTKQLCENGVNKGSNGNYCVWVDKEISGEAGSPLLPYTSIIGQCKECKTQVKKCSDYGVLDNIIQSGDFSSCVTDKCGITPVSSCEVRISNKPFWRALTPGKRGYCVS